MSSFNLEQLYRAVIMDHYKNPHNKGLIDDDSYYKVHLNNPSCGDDITVEVKLTDGIVTDIRHDGHGCSICCSSASVMSEIVKGKKIDEANEIINSFLGMVKGDEVKDDESLGEAIAYMGVRQFPARIKCATLSWKAVQRAINEVETNE